MASVVLRLAALVSLLLLVPPSSAADAPVAAAHAPGPAVDLSPGAPSTWAPSRPSHARDALTRWNAIAIDASGLDHTPVAPGESRVYGEQLGPGRSSRAMAIVHVAVFEALNSIGGGYRSSLGLGPAAPGASRDAAIAAAAHDALVALYPSQRDALDRALDAELARVDDTAGRRRGEAAGRRAAAAILAKRQGDGAEVPEPLVGIEFPTSDAPGAWRQDPISRIPLALGAYWGSVAPFVIGPVRAFRVPPPPDLTSAAYTAAFDEVLALGGDGLVTPTLRSAEQTEIGLFWAYDGTPSLCAPPRLYNQITLTIANQMGTKGVELARLLALVNVAMADAAIAVWDSKYAYAFWRPITGIREADPGTGPTGAGDGNPDTIGDPTFSPLGAPASNLMGPNFTPPFPSYPSGHAGFGGAVFQTLRRFYGRDRIAFTFVSDELNGVTRDNAGNVRPLRPRRFASLSQAEDENGQSRIYLGIHWAFDKTEGIAQGRRVGDAVFDHLFRPSRAGGR
ncbi:MAG TPA: vanadium-dependent haloperoxidase [Myxococcota bacterium]|jgi:hypothetical protein|nr:vanadium-dependent haloperoxidase [Myxococcota bacterium]